MFAQLFTQPYALARHRDAPLTEERRQFLAHLAAERELSRNTLRTIANWLFKIIDTLDLAHRRGESICRDEIVEKTASECKYLIAPAVRWLQFLGRLKQQRIRANPYADKVEAFVDYMRNEKGYATSTVKRRARFVRRFLGQYGVPSGSLHKIPITRIDEALTGMVHQDRYGRGTVKTWARDLRAFLYYAETHGWCRKGLAAAIKCPRTFTQVSLPSGPSWDDVRSLLAMTEGSRPTDIRDRAILMLLAVYGLRQGEVKGLRLDDLDWERELISVECPKTRRARIYPLIRPLGDAILRYLKEVRPQSACREVFLTMLRPFRPLRRGISRVVDVRLRRLGVHLPHYGPHALRHSCATHLLAQGLSLKEIGDHLGHQSPDTTRIYAKVDLAGLRQVAAFDLGGLQ